MNGLLLFALTITMSLFDLSESTPATLCAYTSCHRGECNTRHVLQVRNGYRGEAWFGQCSSDGVFCVRGDRFMTVLRYQNANRYINTDVWVRGDKVDDWCKKEGGKAYWFEA